MTGIIIALLMIGGSIAGIVWWQTQRPRPALPPVVPPPPASAAPPISAPPPVPDAADPRRIAAEQTLARLQAATTALFGSEYLAASQVTAWQQAHPQTLAQATERSWLDWLSPELRPVAEQYCQPLRTLPQAIADHNAAVMRERLHEDAAAFDRVERFPLTPRQREAIVTDQDTTLVIAGAGTGKTSTIVGKVDYLIRRQLAAPDEILVLAYGKKAQEELQERLRALGHGQGVTISTFHALGLKIIRQAQQRPIRTTPLTEDAARHRFLQDIVTESWSDPVLQPILRDFFSTMLEAESPDAQQKHRTITGEVLRSGEEVQIATWLTLHGIRWAYERPYPIDTTTAGRRQYLPDFYLPDYDLYLEHFGIDRQGRTRADIDARQYQADMAWKRELHRTHGTRLLETFSYMTTEGGL
ncbi:MAG TPA: UvrD-helicase domain-containing protein, partial [Herpetosiphonaceae bacterium]